MSNNCLGLPTARRWPTTMVQVRVRARAWAWGTRHLVVPMVDTINKALVLRPAAHQRVRFYLPLLLLRLVRLCAQVNCRFLCNLHLLLRRLEAPFWLTIGKTSQWQVRAHVLLLVVQECLLYPLCPCIPLLIRDTVSGQTWVQARVQVQVRVLLLRTQARVRVLARAARVLDRRPWPFHPRCRWARAKALTLTRDASSRSCACMLRNLEP